MNALKRHLKWAVPFLWVVSVSLILGGCGDSDSSSTVTFGQTIQKTSAYIEKEMEKHDGVGLSIALVSDDRVVWAQGFGLADKKNGVLATADTVYALGSGTKTITTVALMKLVEQGMVSLDAPVADYLTDFTLLPRFPDKGQMITVRRLLNHHSGIPGDLYTAGFLSGEPWNQWGACDDYMNWLLNYLGTDYPSHPPGQMATYSNTGFVLAGEICLRTDGLSGETFPDYLDRKVFTPLGMAHTSLFVIRENLAKGYKNGEPSEISQTNCTFGATGGAFTTVKDMARFLIMVINGGMGPNGTRILAPENVAVLGEAERSSLDIDSFFQPGLGLDTMDDSVMKYAGRAWMKSGGTGDYYSLMEMLPDQKLGVTVLTNSDTARHFMWGVVRECLKNALLEKTGISPSPPDLPTYVSVNAPSEIEGIYVKRYGYDKVIDNGDKTLTWIIDAHSPNSMTSLLKYEDNAYHPEGRTESIIFKNMEWDGNTYFVMIQSGSSGSDTDKYLYGGYVRTIVGQKYPTPVLPDIWKARLGVYVLDNLPWDDAAFSEPFSLLEESDGMLIHDIQNMQSAAIPENDTTAFLVGLCSRSDSSIRVVQEDGKEKVYCGGYRGYLMDQVPQIEPGDVVSGTVSLFKSDWYRFDGDASGQEVTITVEPHGSNYALTLFDSNLTYMKREMGVLSWTAQGGPCFVAVSPTPDADGEYTMSVDAAPAT
jgi:CubicO group peptidase (beta-lactamase class C family)